MKFLFHKENLHRTLYHLILNDELLSAEYRKSVISRVQPDFTGDTALTDIIYEAVYTALTRPYHKSDVGYIAKSYFDPLEPLDNSLFANGKPVALCRHFCGRDAESEELHTFLQEECLYSLGLFHLCMNDTENSEKELVRAFQIYLKIHDRDSEFIQYRLSELKRYMETADSEFTAIQKLFS